MSLLEELKQQAQAKKEKEQAEQRRHAQAEEIYRSEVRPRLAQAATYLSELAEHLNFVQPDIRVDYPIKTYGTLEGLRQSGYRASTEGQPEIRAITFTFTCAGERPMSFDVQGEALMSRETEFLRDNRLTMTRREHWGPHRNITGATFKVDPKVPVGIRLDLAADMTNIVLTVSNLDSLQTRRYPLDYHKLNGEFLDELGKAVLRQENSFLRLDISPEERERLRKQLDRISRKRVERQPESDSPPATARARHTEPLPAAQPSGKLAQAPSGRTKAKGPPEVPLTFSRAAVPTEPAGARPAATEETGGEPRLDEQLRHIGDLQRTPMQLLDAAGWILTTLNSVPLGQPGRRLQYAESILQHAHGALARFYGEFVRGAGGLPEDEYRREALSRCVNVAAYLANSYAQALHEDYPEDPADYDRARARIVLCGFRALELARLEQRFRALRYQRMPADAWRDCNRVFFLLAAHGDTEQSLPLGCEVGFSARAGVGRRHRPTATPLDLYLSLQLFGFLDVTMWPVQLFHLPDSYLDATKTRVHVIADDGEALPPGRLLATRDDAGPAQAVRPPRVSAPAIELDYTELFTQAVRDRMELDKMSFIGQFDRDRVSHTIAAVPELDRLAGLDLLLHSLTRRERSQARRAVLDDQRLHVHFGFNECYRLIRQTGTHPPVRPSPPKAQGHHANEPADWNLVNFSTGGLLVGTTRPDLPRPARIGDLVVFAPVDNTHLPLIGYVARLQHPSDFEVQVAVVRLSRYAEAAAIQSGEADRMFEQPVILVQDVKNQWRIVMPPDYGFVTGAPLKLIRADGRTVPARLGDLRLTRPEFAVFDVRSPGLEGTPVEPELPGQ
ncbi:MAG: hypothetical protein P8009_00870 [Gammaproteobacteria bacterium]